MSSYFPIPPNIKTEELSTTIFGSITFLNIPNNRLKSSFLRRKYKDKVFLGIYKIKDKCWTLTKTFECPPSEFIEINRKDLNATDSEILVAVPKKNNKFLDQVSDLPQPSSLKIDGSPIADRVSINFSFHKSLASYQGEYPLEMTFLKETSFLSFDVLKEPYQSKVFNYLILVNIFKNASLQDDIRIDYFNPMNKNNIKSFIAKRNSFTVKNMSLLEDQFEDSKTLFLRSNKCGFIPLVLSICKDSKKLSLEHTHPPGEFFYGLRKFEGVKLLKQQWF